MSKRNSNAISISSDSDDENTNEKIFKSEIDAYNQPSTSHNTEASDMIHMKQHNIPDLLKVRLRYTKDWEGLAKISIQID